jgi:hypothetical protein
MIRNILQKTETKNLRYYNVFFDSAIRIYKEIEKIEFFKNEKIKKSIFDELLVLLQHKYIYLPTYKPTGNTVMDLAKTMYPFLDYGVVPPDYSFVKVYKDIGYIDIKLMRKELRERYLYYKNKHFLRKELSILSDIKSYRYKDTRQAIIKIEKEYKKVRDINLLVDVYKKIEFMEYLGYVKKEKFTSIKEDIFENMKNIILSDKNLWDKDFHRDFLLVHNVDLAKFFDSITKDVTKKRNSEKEKMFVGRNFSEELEIYYRSNPQELITCLDNNAEKIVKGNYFEEYVNFAIKVFCNCSGLEKECLIKPINKLISSAKEPNQIEVIRYFILRVYTRYDSNKYNELFGVLKNKIVELINDFEQEK